MPFLSIGVFSSLVVIACWILWREKDEALMIQHWIPITVLKYYCTHLIMLEIGKHADSAECDVTCVKFKNFI